MCCMFLNPHEVVRPLSHSEPKTNLLGTMDDNINLIIGVQAICHLRVQVQLPNDYQSLYSNLGAPKLGPF